MLKRIIDFYRTGPDRPPILDPDRFLDAWVWHARFIAGNDPGQVTADCEADLAILDAHFHGSQGQFGRQRVFAFDIQAVRCFLQHFGG